MSVRPGGGAEAVPWFADDGFWNAVSPVLFGPEAQQAAESEALQLAQALKVEPGASILDVFCGPGRLARPLAALGYRVLGVDRTDGFLTAARAAEWPNGTEAPVYRRVAFGPGGSAEGMERLVEPLDAAIWAGLSTGYDGIGFDRAVLSWIHRALRPGGPLLLEVSTLEDLHEPGFESVEWFEERGPEQTAATAVWRLRHALVESSTDGHWFEGAWQRFRLGMADEFSFRYRVYSRDHWTTILDEAGFTNIRFEDHLAGFGSRTSLGTQPRERAQSWIRAETPA